MNGPCNQLIACMIELAEGAAAMPKSNCRGSLLPCWNPSSKQPRSRPISSSYRSIRQAVDAGMLDPVAAMPQAPQQDSAGPALDKSENLHKGVRRIYQLQQMTNLQNITEEQSDDGVASLQTFQTPSLSPLELQKHIEQKFHNLNIFKQEFKRVEELQATTAGTAPSSSTSGAKHLFSLPRSAGGGKPSSNILSKFLKNPKVPSTTVKSNYKVPENYILPPHPYDVGKVSKVNICPVCEKYTVTELDRPVINYSDPISPETLWARFNCERCQKLFDIDIVLFDPRGLSGVTLFEGDDRFRPPAPPLGNNYPCPRCWDNSNYTGHTNSTFQCMTCYVREESRVPCQPACPPERLHWEQPEDEEKAKRREMCRKILDTVLGRF